MDVGYAASSNLMCVGNDDGETRTVYSGDQPLAASEDAWGSGRDVGEYFYLAGSGQVVMTTSDGGDSCQVMADGDTVVVRQATTTQTGGNLTLATRGETYGLASPQGGLVVKCDYDGAVMHSDGSVFALRRDDRWYYYAADGQRLLDFTVKAEGNNGSNDDWWDSQDNSTCYPYLATEGYMPVQEEDGAYGYYTDTGEEVVLLGTFEEARPVHGGLAWVKQAGKWGVIRLVDPDQSDAWRWALEPTITADNIIVTDKKVEGTGYLHYATEECAYLVRGEKYGIIRYDGTLLAGAAYTAYTTLDLCDSAIPNLMCVYEKGGERRLTVFSSDDPLATSQAAEAIYSYYGGSQNVVVQEADSTTDSGIGKKKVGHIGVSYGIANQDGLVVTCGYDGAVMHHGGDVIALRDGEEWYYFDQDGRVILPFGCEAEDSNASNDGMWDADANSIAYPYLPTEGYIPIQVDGTYGYYTVAGDEVVPIGTFEEARPVHGGQAWVKKNGKWGVIEFT